MYIVANANAPLLITASNSAFVDNSANIAGGGFYIGDIANVSLEFSSVNFIDNTATQGSFLYLNGSRFSKVSIRSWFDFQLNCYEESMTKPSKSWDIECNKCATGEYQLEECPANSCRPRPSGATCTGGNQITAEEG